MVHLSSFEAIHFRGLDGLALKKLTKANLITGANGIGKTALIEAMWIFTGRYKPNILWNANVQRSPTPPLNPISQLASDELKLRGVENGIRHDVNFRFEAISSIPQNREAIGASSENTKRLPPVMGVIRSKFDGKALTAGYEEIHVSPFGTVMFQSSEEAVGRPGCVIESTKFQ